MAKTTVTIEDDRREEALKRALAELSAPEEAVEVKVIQEGSTGFLGFLSKPWKLKVTLKTPRERETDEPSPAGRAKPAPPAFAGWRILSNSEGLFFLLEKPGPGMRLPEMADVIKDLRELGLVRADLDALRTAFLPGNYDTPIRIAAADPGFSFDRDSRIEASVDHDAMAARITVTKPFGSGKAPTRAMVIDKLKQLGVRVPVDERAIDRLLEERRFGEELVVARGTPPIHGEDGSIRWRVDADTDKIRITIREDGTVDFHKALKINNVRAGDVLGERRDATRGKPGHDVRMNPLPAKDGRDVQLVPGRNVEISEDGRKLVAAIDGQLLVRGNVATVLPVFEVRGNVDISTGDIDFVGNVIVHGDVTDGFEVKADGNVEVRGMVNCSRLQATGNVLILGGFLGKDKGEIVCDGSVGVKFVENGTIRAADSVIVEKAVMHSTILAGKRIHVKGTKGLIVGGNATAGEEIEAVTIGSALGTRTSLSVGIDFASRERSAKLERELEEVNINLEKLHKTLGFFERIAKASGALSPEQELLRSKSVSILNQLILRKKELEKERIEFEAGLEAATTGRVICHAVMYPGVSVTIRKAVLLVKDPLKCSSLALRDGEIRVGPII